MADGTCSDVNGSGLGSVWRWGLVVFRRRGTQLIDTNIVGSVFLIRYGEGTATCFVLNHEDRQYIVTAKHVVSAIEETDTVDLYHSGRWKSLPVRLVGHGAGNIDVSVLAGSHSIGSETPLPASCLGITLGQDTFFLGFPYGMKAEAPGFNDDFPIPLVKKATLSAILFEQNLLILDGHGNPGFSGGPVLFTPPGSKGNHIAGVVCSYRGDEKRVLVRNETGGTAETSLFVKENSGIVYAYNIRCALGLINENPIGQKLTS